MSCSSPQFLHWVPDHPAVHLCGLAGQHDDEDVPGDSVGVLRTGAGHVRHHSLTLGGDQQEAQTVHTPDNPLYSLSSRGRIME